MRLSLYDRGLTALTPLFVESHGARLEELDLSKNSIADLSPLRDCVQLRSLVLSYNPHVTSTLHFPIIPTLHTLWVNWCRVDNMALFAERVARAFPNLRHLSMFGNTCCPTFLTGDSRAHYIDYRLFAVSRLPLIECLEDEPVTADERARAMAKYGAPSETPGLEAVLGRKREVLDKKKKKRSHKYAAVVSPRGSGVQGLVHPYARREELVIPGQSADAEDEWTTDEEDVDCNPSLCGRFFAFF